MDKENDLSIPVTLDLGRKSILSKKAEILKKLRTVRTRSEKAVLEGELLQCEVMETRARKMLLMLEEALEKARLQ